MPIITETEVLNRANIEKSFLRKSANQIIQEHASFRASFDVFLSHSSNEPEDILLGITMMLRDIGFSVYVDKYVDPQLSPNSVTHETAEVLRTRLNSSNSLLYVYSRHSTTSRWMPWELGFFDGYKGKVAILPVAQQTSFGFKGEEYLSLYPFIDKTTQSDTRKTTYWVNHNSGNCEQLVNWIRH